MNHSPMSHRPARSRIIIAAPSLLLLLPPPHPPSTPPRAPASANTAAPPNVSWPPSLRRFNQLFTRGGGTAEAKSQKVAISAKKIPRMHLKLVPMERPHSSKSRDGAGFITSETSGRWEPAQLATSVRGGWGEVKP